MWRVSFLVLLATTSVLSVPELKLVHVVFSHKFYAPVETTSGNGTLCPSVLDYRYFLEQTVDMNNGAKMDMFNLGAFLRQKYNSFLGDIYHPDFTKMRTTEYVLSMISGMLVDAGLWPPVGVQKWNPELEWQPIPTEYQPVKKDTLLLGHFCPSFKAEEKSMINDFSSIINEHVYLFDYITRHYGKKIETPWDVVMLYSCLDTIAAQNGTIPSWASSIDAEMQNVTLKAYATLSKTSLQKKLNGGSLLKKILLDSVAHENSRGKSKLKLSMYSGEDRNLIALLENMGLWTPHILDQGASVIFEVYGDSVTHEYTIKMFYLSDVKSFKLDPLKLNNCEEYCPLIKFSSILNDILPVDEMSICHQERATPPKNDKSAARLSHAISVSVILMGLVLTQIG